MRTPDRRARLDRHHRVLSIRGQCRLLGIANSGDTRPRAQFRGLQRSRSVVRDVRGAGKEVSVCGEMADDPAGARRQSH